MTNLKTYHFGNTILDKVEFSSKDDVDLSFLDVKDWAKSVDADDSVLTDVMYGVVDEYSQMLNASLVDQTVTATFQSYGKEVKLPYSPVISVTTVKSLDEGVKTDIETDNYYLQGDSLFFEVLENTGLEVVYEAGYGTLPSGLKQALKQAILTAYNDREDNALGGVSNIPSNSRKRALRYKRY